MNVGEYIKKIRVDAGLSQEELGKQLGVQRAAVQKWECGRVQNLKRDIIKKLSTIFNVPPASFIEVYSNDIQSDALLSQKLKELRLNKGITQTEFAETFNIANGTVGNWETGKREPDYEMLSRIADFYGVTVDYLLGRDPKERPAKFKEKFIQLCNEKQESPSFVCKQVGISPAAFTQWTDSSVPRKATLMRIADYFGVSIKYLTGETDQKEKPAENDRLEENTVLLAMRDGGVKKRKLTSEQMELIEKMIEQMPQADDDL